MRDRKTFRSQLLHNPKISNVCLCVCVSVSVRVRVCEREREYVCVGVSGLMEICEH